MNKDKPKPLKDYVIVDCSVEQIVKYEEGKFISDLPTGNKSAEGKVVSVGPDVKSLSTGDFVLIRENVHCQELKISGKDLVVIKEEDIAVVFEQ